MRRKMAIWMSILVVTLFVLFVAWFSALSLTAKRPSDLGLCAGRLRPCPASPNCVCSQDSDQQHGIATLSFVGATPQAIEKLTSVIEALPRAKIVTREGNYLHAEFTTLVFRFVDDVEFLVDEAAGRIEFRSASRVGHSDLGVNRARLEAIRAAFEAQQ